MSLTIPREWESKPRDREIFVNCAPKIESRPGMPGCYFTARKVKPASGQKAITDADRALWKSWVFADGLRPIVSTRDSKVAGYPAFEVVMRHGREFDAVKGIRVFVLVPDWGILDAQLYAYWGNQDQHWRMEPAFRSAIESLKIAK